MNKYFILFCISFCLIMASPNLLLGQSQKSKNIEKIVVTATKKTETLQEAPVAVSVVSSETIEQLNVNDILDI